MRTVLTGIAVASLIVASTPAAPAAETGCVPSRPAVSYREGELPLILPGAPIPCVHPTGHIAYEPAMEITDEAIFMKTVIPVGIDVQIPEVIGSSNMGESWQNASPSIAGQNAHAFTLDPVLFAEADGRLWTADYQGGCTMVSWSVDGGQRWTTVPASCGETLFHETLFGGPGPGGVGRALYLCAVHAGGGQFSVATTCSSSADGVVWLPTGAPPFITDPAQPDGNFGVAGYCDGMTGHGAVGPDGTVYLGKGFCGRPTVAVSHDGGLTWTRSQIAATGMARTRDNRPDHELHVAVDEAGTVYATWVGYNRKPLVAYSTDKGAHWSEPIMVGRADLTEADRPSIAAGAAGGIVVAYIGTQNGPAGPPFPGEATCPPAGPCSARPEYATTNWNGYITITDNLLAADPIFTTATVNDPSEPIRVGECGPGGCLGLGNGVAVAAIAPDGTAWAAFPDGCPGPGCLAGEPEAVAVHLS
jgi:hypothetical protein